MSGKGIADLDDEARARLGRWRLLLGKDAERSGIAIAEEAGGEMTAAEEALAFLFDEGAGRSTSVLDVPTWIDTVGELFPREAKEVLERELVSRRGIRELLEQSEILERIEPNLDLVKTLLTHKDLLSPKTRVLARKVIDKVVEDLRRKLRPKVEQAITGALRKDAHSPRRVYRNVDLRTTIRRNLKNWSAEHQRLFVERLWFHAAEKSKRPWHVVVCVDQSGSMLESAIFSSIMASIFAELPGVKTSLVLFDTEVVDLTDEVGQPVDVLLSVQLGGGTDIARALAYCGSLVRVPARTIVVLVSDFYEGRPEEELLRTATRLADANVRLVGLAALGYDAQPQYNRQTARRLRKIGMDILVCTPERLAECMARIVKG